MTTTVDDQPYRRPKAVPVSVDLLAEPIEPLGSLGLPRGDAREVDVQDFVAAGGWIETVPAALEGEGA